METDKVTLNDMYPLISAQLNEGGSVRFKPKGTSMLPTLRQGLDEVVITKLQGKPRKLDILFYRRENGQFVLHRLQKIKNGSYIIRGDHQFEYEYGITDENIIGVVTQIHRDGAVIKRGTIKFNLYGSLGALSYRTKYRLRKIVPAFLRRLVCLLKKKSKH